LIDHVVVCIKRSFEGIDFVKAPRVSSGRDGSIRNNGIASVIGAGEPATFGGRQRPVAQKLSLCPGEASLSGCAGRRPQGYRIMTLTLPTYRVSRSKGAYGKYN
jgi:hypothetical protein